jgi:hypothetical protein
MYEVIFCNRCRFSALFAKNLFCFFVGEKRLEIDNINIIKKQRSLSITNTIYYLSCCIPPRMSISIGLVNQIFTRPISLVV